MIIMVYNAKFSFTETKSYRNGSYTEGVLSIFSWGFFWINYCSSARLHGAHQPVVLLWCEGSPGCFISIFYLIYIVGSAFSHHDNTPQALGRAQVRQFWWQISDTMVIKAPTGTFIEHIYLQHFPLPLNLWLICLTTTHWTASFFSKEFDYLLLVVGWQSSPQPYLECVGRNIAAT